MTDETGPEEFADRVAALQRRPARPFDHVPHECGDLNTTKISAHENNPVIRGCRAESHRRWFTGE